MVKQGKSFAMKNGRVYAYVGAKYIGTYATRAEALAASKKADAKMLLKKQAKIKSALPVTTFACFRGRCVKVCG